MFNFFRLASRDRVTWADTGRPTDNRRPPGATSGPLFPSHMTPQYSNWVGPILSSGFRVAAKLAFSDWPQATPGKKGPKRPFWGPFVSELRSFFTQKPVENSSKAVSELVQAGARMVETAEIFTQECADDPSTVMSVSKLQSRLSSGKEQKPDEPPWWRQRRRRKRSERR